MHHPERGSGQGREHQRVLRDGLRNGLAADHTGADQVEHVRRVQPGAGRALGRTSVAAPHMRDAERLLLAAVGRDDLAGRGVDSLGVAAESDRTGAVPDPR
jgi:hypothetical protein